MITPIVPVFVTPPPSTQEEQNERTDSPLGLHRADRGLALTALSKRHLHPPITEDASKRPPRVRTSPRHHHGSWLSARSRLIENETRELFAKKVAAITKGMHALQLEEYSPDTIQALVSHVANRLFFSSNTPYSRANINGEVIKFYCKEKAGKIAFRKLHDHRPFPNGSVKIIKPAILVSASSSRTRVEKVVRFVLAPKGREEDLYNELSYYLDKSLNGSPGLPRLRFCTTYGRHAKLAMFVEAFDGDLYRHIQENQSEIPEEEKLSILWQLASGLAALHQHVDEKNRSDPIAHYDVKQENALYRIRHDTLGIPRYTVALTDFGFSFHIRKHEWNEGRRAMGEHKYGTRIVEAPEFFDAGLCDSLKADIWALAHIYYHLLVGREPPIAFQVDSYEHEIPCNKQAIINFVETLDAIQLESPALQSAFQLCQRMFCIEAEKRPDIQEIRDEIRHIAEGHGYSNVGKTSH